MTPELPENAQLRSGSTLGGAPLRPEGVEDTEIQLAADSAEHGVERTSHGSPEDTEPSHHLRRRSARAVSRRPDIRGLIAQA